jgi:serine/threonine protein kinase, bacterial
MAHCINPDCSHPDNPADTDTCLACGSSLLLKGRYELTSALAQGGFGATFLAKDRNIPGRPERVIKQLRPNATSPSVLRMARELFEREATTLGKIGSHPQIPALMDYFEERSEFYLVQEFVKGLTLHQEIKQDGPVTEQGAKQVLSELLPMLDYIHSQQVIHRDIKPANIIRRAQDRKLVLIDFGAVKDQVGPVSENSDMTALTSFAIGTPGYAPPEQMAMRPIYSSDVYALGVTCIYLLTGKSPKELGYNPATGEIMWQSNIHVSSHFADVLSKMLDMSVRHRYQSATEVLEALNMAPYMDSLAQSMMTRPGSASTTPTGGDLQQASPFAREAEAIRKRQQSNRRVDGGMLRGPSTGGKPASTGGRSAIPTSTLGGSTIGNTTGRTTGRTGRLGPSTGGRTGATPPARVQKIGPLDLQKRYDQGHRDFANHDFSALNLQRLTLSGSEFHESRFVGANLQGADLSKANLGHTNFSQARLRDAKLMGAYLTNSDLREADLRGANLTNAHLSNANLRQANLCGADLTGAKVTDEQLAQAKLSWNTVFPNGRRGGLFG